MILLSASSQVPVDGQRAARRTMMSQGPAIGNLRAARVGRDRIGRDRMVRALSGGKNR